VYDQIKTQLDTITELSDEQLAELQADIISQFEMVEGEDPSPETVDAMTSLADSLDTVRGELANREAAATELAQRAADATARVKGQVADEGEEMAMTENKPNEEETPVEEVAPTEETPEEVAPAEEAPAETEETPADEAKETPEEAKKEEEEGTEKAMSASADTETAPETSEAVVEAPVEAEAAVEETVVDASEGVATTEAVEASEASTDQVDGSELSTTTEEATELSTDETAEAVAEVEEVAELSSEATIETSTALVEEQNQEQAVTAAAEQPFEAPADRQPVVQEIVNPVAITAGADIPGYSAGSTVNDLNEVATLMEKRLHSLRRVNGGDGEQHIVASFSTQYSEDRFLGTDAEANAAKINAGTALVASGGHAAPAEVKYDIFGIGSTTNRPVRDALPKFQADRGGVRYVTPPSFASGDYADAVGVWTAATDADPQSATKTSLTVSAAQENVAVTDAVTLQIQFGNLMTRAYPELIARHNELALVQHAREAEANLLSKIGTASTAVTSGTLIGFGRDFLVSVRKAAVAYRSRHRIAPTTKLTAIVPDWIFDAMAADLAVAMPGDNNLGVTKSEIEGYLALSNVNLVASPDLNYYGAQAGSAALTEFKDSFVWYLFAEGTFLFLDGGTLDLGIIRDSSLVGTNDYKMFVETFEGIAKVGIESLAITQTVNVNGVAAALRDTTGGASAAAIEL
jgi:chemotaxis protein histidine kinase CheA